MLDDLVPAAVTTVGSMPGTSPVDAVGLIVGELAQGDGVPHLPELPARGPGADMVGRTAGLLADIAPDLAVETTPDGWRFADAPGRSMRRARSWLAEDLDAFEEALEGYDGWVGASLTGPWTLAAAIELRRGERAVRDPGASRDLAGALAQAAEVHVAELRRRVPAARIMLWFDEPALPAVLEGSLPTQSGRGRYAAVEQHVAETALAALVDAVHRVDAAAVIHCCAERPPLALLRRTGADALSVDLLIHDQRDDDELGELLDAGRRLVAGVVPGTGPASASPASEVGDTVGHVTALGNRLGLSAESLAQGVLLSPTCGLAGAAPAAARRTLTVLRGAGRALRQDDPVAVDEER